MTYSDILDTITILHHAESVLIREAGKVLASGVEAAGVYGSRYVELTGAAGALCRRRMLLEDQLRP